MDKIETEIYPTDIAFCGGGGQMNHTIYFYRQVRRKTDDVLYEWLGEVHREITLPFQPYQGLVIKGKDMYVVFDHRLQWDLEKECWECSGPAVDLKQAEKMVEEGWTLERFEGRPGAS